jgi:hypothetical protein
VFKKRKSNDWVKRIIFGQVAQLALVDLALKYTTISTQTEELLMR